MVTNVTLPLIKPSYTLHFAIEHMGVSREVFWFKYTKKGDFIFNPSLEAGQSGFRNGRMAERGGIPADFSDIAWGPPSERDHFTLHPSTADEFGRRGSAVNGPGGVKPTGLDLRTLFVTRPLVSHRLARPDAYPVVKRGVPTVHLGRAYALGAPEVWFFVVPLDGEAVAGNFMRLGQPNGTEFIIAPERLTDRRFMVQVRLEHDKGRPWWPHHQTSFPRFNDHPVPEEG